MRLLVLALHMALRAGGADRLDAVHRLDQQALHIGHLVLLRQHAAPHQALHAHRHQQDQRHRDHQHQRQRSGQQPGRGDEQRDEGQIADHRHRGRGGELAHHLELGHVVCEGAGRVGPVLQPQPERLAHQHAAQRQIGTPAGLVDQVAAQLARHQIEAGGQQRADGQRPQREGRLVRNDPVVDHHREQSARQHQHIAEQGGQHRAAVIGQIAAQRAPEPVAVQRLGRRVGRRARGQAAHAERLARTGQQHVAVVQRAQRRIVQTLRGRRRAAGIEDQQLVDPAAIRLDMARQQHRGAAVAQRQQHRQQQRQHLAGIAPHPPGLQAGVLEHLAGAGGRERTRHAQAVEQRIGAALDAVVAAEPVHRAEQRVGAAGRGLPGRCDGVHAVLRSRLIRCTPRHSWLRIWKLPRKPYIEAHRTLSSKYSGKVSSVMMLTWVGSRKAGPCGKAGVKDMNTPPGLSTRWISFITSTKALRRCGR
jgi:hypothetical protein